MEREKLTRLVTGAQAGDPDAMDALFGEFYNEVYYFALKTTKNEDVACDVTQETFLRVIESIGSLKEPVAFVTWLRQITYHQCTRHFAKKTEVQVEEDEDGNSVFDTLADEGAIPAEILEKEEFRQTIMGMIEQLSEEQRAAVLLYYYDELSVGQIAQIQGVSEGTVKSRLNYARKAIKKSVEGYEKKHNIKLHSFAFLPLFMLFFGKAVMPEAKAAAVRGTVMASAKAAAAAGAGVGTGVAAAATKGSVLGAIAKLPVVTKVVAGVLAGVLAVGATVGTVALVNQPEDEPIMMEDDEEDEDEGDVLPDGVFPQQKPQTNPYQQYGLVLAQFSLAYQGIFDSYIGNNGVYAKTTDGRIIRAYISDELFPVMENVREAWTLNPDGKLAYYDNAGVFYVMYEGEMYVCPEVSGTPVTLYNGDFGDGICVVLDYYDDQGNMYYCRYRMGENNTLVLVSKDQTTMWDQSTFSEVARVDRVTRWTYYDCQGRYTVLSNLLISDGMVYSYDGRQTVTATGIPEADLLADTNYGPIIYKTEDPSVVNILVHRGHSQPMTLPDGRTADQITQMIGAYRSGTIFFADGAVYQYDVADQQYQVSYNEALTTLNREGKIKAAIQAYNMDGPHLLMDDNLVYIYRGEKAVTTDNLFNCTATAAQ